jgi:hypothetical protein
MSKKYNVFAQTTSSLVSSLCLPSQTSFHPLAPKTFAGQRNFTALAFFDGAAEEPKAAD